MKHGILAPYVALATLAGLGLRAAADEPEAGAASEPFPSELAIGYDQKSGNTDSDAFKIGGKHVRTFDKQEIILKGSFEYGKTGDEKDVDKALGSADYNIAITRRSYVNVGIEGSYDELADVDYRWVVGLPSWGYRWVDTKATHVTTEVGTAYLWEKVGGETRESPVGRVWEEIRHTIDRLTVWESVEYLPESAHRFGTIYLMTAEVGMESEVNSHLAMRMVAVNTFDSQPAEDRERNDLHIHAALVVKF